MTSLEMLSDLASRLGDPELNRFTPGELQFWLNGGQTDVVRRLDGINADWFLMESFLVSSASGADVPLPAGCRVVRAVRVLPSCWGVSGTKYVAARRLTAEEYAKVLLNKDWEATLTDPVWLQVGTALQILPLTTAAVTLGIGLLYSKTVPALTAWTDAETSVIRPEHHDLVVLFAEIIARRREGANVEALVAQYERAFADIKQSLDVTIMRPR